MEPDQPKPAAEERQDLATTPSAEPDAEAVTEPRAATVPDTMVARRYFGLQTALFDEAELRRAMGDLRHLASELGFEVANFELELRAGSLVVRGTDEEAVRRLVDALLSSNSALERAAETDTAEALIVVSETYRQERVEGCAEDFAGDIEALGKELGLEGLTVSVLDGAVLELQMPTAPERLDELSEGLFQPTSEVSLRLVSRTPESEAYLVEVLEQLPLQARAPESQGVCARAVEGLGSAVELLRQAVSTAQVSLPAGKKVGYTEVTVSGASPIWCLHLVEEEVSDITGEHLLQAYVAFDEQLQKPYVALTLNWEGGQRLEALSRSNVGRALALMVDDRIISAPVIRAAIPGAQVSIDLGPISSAADRARYAQEAAALARSLRRQTMARLLLPLEEYQPAQLDLGALPSVHGGDLAAALPPSTWTVRLHLGSLFDSASLKDAVALGAHSLGIGSASMSSLLDEQLLDSWLLFRVAGPPLLWIHSPGRAASLAAAYRSRVPGQVLPEYSFEAWSEEGGLELHQRTEDDLLLGARELLRQLRSPEAAPWVGPQGALDSAILVYGALPNEGLFVAQLQAGPPISFEIAVASEEQARELQRKLGLLLAPNSVLSSTLAQLAAASKDGSETLEQLLSELRRAVVDASFVTKDGWVRMKVSLLASGPTSELKPLVRTLTTLAANGTPVLQSMALAHYFVALYAEHSQHVARPEEQMTVFSWLNPSFALEDESAFQDGWGRALYVAPNPARGGFDVCSPGVDGISGSADDLCVGSP